jgi:hypothetical protein
MSEELRNSTCDLIRWSFTIDPERKAEVETYLNDLGLDVFLRADGQVTVLWDEPEGQASEIIEGLWEAHGSSFEVTHEEFSRINLMSYHEEDAEVSV